MQIEHSSEPLRKTTNGMRHRLHHRTFCAFSSCQQLGEHSVHHRISQRTHIDIPNSFKLKYLEQFIISCFAVVSHFTEWIMWVTHIKFYGLILILEIFLFLSKQSINRNFLLNWPMPMTGSNNSFSMHKYFLIQNPLSLFGQMFRNGRMLARSTCAFVILSDLFSWDYLTWNGEFVVIGPSGDSSTMTWTNIFKCYRRNQKLIHRDWYGTANMYWSSNDRSTDPSPLLVHLHKQTKLNKYFIGSGEAVLLERRRQE